MQLLRRYVHGGGADEPLLWYEGSGLTTRRGLLTNHQGSIIAVADAAGASLGINAYDAYGVPNPGNIGRFQYTGQVWLAEVGLYYYKARLYSPSLGRFLQTDPIGYDDEFNLYAYVGNDPLNGADPTGTCGTGTLIEGAAASECKVLGFPKREDTAGKSGEAANVPIQTSDRVENASGSVTDPTESDLTSNEDSIDAKIKALTARGDVEGLKGLLEAANPQQARLISGGIQRLETRAADIIAKELKGSANREFPQQMREKSLAEIFRLARGGDAAAQTARKLLTDGRFRKGT